MIEELNVMERMELLIEAEEDLFNAVEKIREALDGTNLLIEAESYIIKHLNSWKDGNNPYDSTSLPRLRERLGKEK